LQQKIVYAGRVASSFANAAQLLEHLAESSMPTKQVERLTRGIGTERVAQRDAAVAAFQALPLAKKFDSPDGVAPPDLACVFVDGGRLQVRARRAAPAPGAGAARAPAAEPEQWDEEPAAGKGFWREDKLGLLAVMKSGRCQADPCPDVPAGFLDVLRIPILARQLGKVAAGGEGGGDEAEPAALAEEVLRQGPAHEPPAVERRLVVGSCRRWSVFARIVAQAAWAAGLHRAKRKAFVADGSANNWRLRERFFSSFVAVLDFIHALSYVYAAALAGQSFEAGWRSYRRWISWVWKGEVKKVLEELAKRQEEVGRPVKGESETSVASVVTRALGYLSNHQDKMNYAEYRQEGLPITSSVMESVVKQMNYRVKGSEKFWCQEGAEAIVQLRADHLSDGAPLDEFFRQRQATATGQRPYRHSA
jgi:hypothetical protein